MDCVKCGGLLSGAETECPHCGVILAKAQTSPPKVAPASPDESVADTAVSPLHYLVVPFRGHIRAGQRIEQVSLQLQELINHHAADGWEFVQIGSVTLTVNEGCWAALFGRGTSQLAYDQVVFRRAASPPL